MPPSEIVQKFAHVKPYESELAEANNHGRDDSFGNRPFQLKRKQFSRAQLRSLIGKEVYVGFADMSSTGWGHLQIDNIRVQYAERPALVTVHNTSCSVERAEDDNPVNLGACARAP